MDKQYEDAMQRMIQWEKEHPNGYVIEDMKKFVFPELKESEDERMRKRAIAILKQQRDYWSYDVPMDKFPPATPRKDLVDAIDVALSYLEKQKEPFIIHDTCFSKMGKMPEYFLDVKPAEWSEEDERNYEFVEGALVGCYSYSFRKNLVNWLKSLRPQPHWKPSKEQMDALKHFIRIWGESGIMSSQNSILCAAKSLLNDLKKL